MLLRGRSRERRRLLHERCALYPGKVPPHNLIRLVYLPIVQCRLVALVDMVSLAVVVALLRAQRSLKDARMRLQNVLQPVQPLLEFATVASLLVLVAVVHRRISQKLTLNPGFFLSLYSHLAPLRLHQRQDGCPRSHFTYRW